MRSPRVGRGLKSFLEVVRFFVTEYRAVGSHGDPIRKQNYDFQPEFYNILSLLLLWYLGCGISGGIWGMRGIWDGIWEYEKGIWEVSEWHLRHLGSNREQSGRHLRDLRSPGAPRRT